MSKTKIYTLTSLLPKNIGNLENITKEISRTKEKNYAGTVVIEFYTNESLFYVTYTVHKYETSYKRRPRTLKKKSEKVTKRPPQKPY